MSRKCETNRELTRTVPSGTANVTSTYFADGKLKSLVATNPGGNTVTTTYSYNNRRLLTGEILQVNSLTPWTTAYGYDANGHLSTQTCPGNMTIGYAPDGLGRPTQAGTFATNVTYYPSGAMAGFTYGNGIVHAMTQNARLLPATSVDSYVSGGVTTKILSDAYTYDANGNVLSLTDTSNAPATDKRTWGTDNPGANPGIVTQYDGLDRLLKVFNPNWGTATGGYNAIYSYDPLDNLRSNRLGASVLTYGYDGFNRLASLSYNGGTAQTVVSNARGDITSNAYRGQAYQFDLTHRLSEVTGKESYLYDGNGRRARTLNLQTNTIEYFGYSLDGRLMQDWSNRRQVRNGYIYLGNTLVGLYEVNITNGAITPKYQHTDALGSPVVTTKKGTLPTDPPVVLSRMAYTPYGQPMAPMDGVGYTGHFIDVGTQLTYMQQRYYDPSMGRFLSIDPVLPARETGGNFSRYWYGNNSPLRYVDPDGSYGNDGSFTAVQWEQFDRAQQAAATRVDAAIDLLTAAIKDPQANAETVKAFENAFGGAFSAQRAAGVLDKLQGISKALHSDGSAETGGYMATRVSEHRMSILLNGADAKNVAAAADQETHMYVNRNHDAAKNGTLLVDVLIHEVGHNSPSNMFDQFMGVNNDKAYRLGSEAERAAFSALKTTGRSDRNPDNYVEFAKP